MQIEGHTRITSCRNITSGQNRNEQGRPMTNQTALHCPAPKQLADYVLGKLDADASTQCEHHLAQCEPCVETINGLDITDTFEGLVLDLERQRPAKIEADEHDSSVVNNLMHRMRSLSHSTGFDRERNSQSGLSADVVRLLDPAESKAELGRIDHYAILEVLGTGSTGVVFRALDVNLNRTVAIKILRPTLGIAARERFIAEARATAILDDPNIVSIFHVGEFGPLAFILMQWLPGETLEEKLSRDSILDCDQTRRFGQQIAAGLAAAHAKGLVHRDIKPANLWITDTDQVKILDFGLVRIMDEDPQLTCTGMIAGTPCFMSPEQSRGDELDPRTDLFSLGCVLYQCLTGKLPFASNNALATLQSIQRDLPVAPNRLDAGVPEEISDLVMMLLEKSPWRRPQTAEDVRAAMESDRVDWNFVCDRYADHDAQPAAASPAQPKSSGDGDGSRTRSRWLWPVVCLLSGVLGFGAFAVALGFGPQIIRIAMNQGQIEIQTNDPDVQVEILQGGQQVQIVDLKTQQSVLIRAGDYQIRPLGEGNAISIDKEKLTLSRGDKVIVTVTKEVDLVEKVAAAKVDTNDEPDPQLSYQLPQLGLPQVEMELASRAAHVEQLRQRLGSGHPDFQDAAEELATLTGLFEQRKEIENMRKTKLNPPAVENPEVTTPLSSSKMLEQLKVEYAAASARVGALRRQRRSDDPEVRKAIAEVSELSEMFHRIVATESQLQAKLNSNSSDVKPKPLDPNHKLQPGDVVRVLVERVLGDFREPIPVAGRTPKGIGFPCSIRADGTLSLPLIPPISVAGKTVLAVEEQIRKVYVEDKKILTPKPRPYISVTLEATRAQSSESLLTEPVYDGLTFEQCLAIVKYERDGEKLIKPLQGLMALAKDDQKAGLYDLTWEAIERVRKINSRSYLEPKYFDWCDDSALQRAILSVAKTNRSSDWQLISRHVGRFFERLQPIHKKLCQLALDWNTIDSLTKTQVLVVFIKSGSIDRKQRDKAVAAVIEMTRLANGIGSTEVLELLVNSLPEMKGLGELFGEFISPRRGTNDQLIEWHRWFKLMSLQNQQDAVPQLLSKAFTWGVGSQYAKNLADVDELIFEFIRPKLEEAVETASSNGSGETANFILRLREKNKSSKQMPSTTESN